MKTLNYRLVIFAFALIFGVVFSIPSLTQSESGKKITLGLDLQGGLHMLLGVKSEEAVTSRIKSIAASLKYALDDKEIIFDELKIDGESVKFELLDDEDVAKVGTLVSEELKGVVLTHDGLLFSLNMTPEEVTLTKKNAISQAVDTIRNRLDQFGLAEPTVAKQGEDKILASVNMEPSRIGICRKRYFSSVLISGKMTSPYFLASAGLIVITLAARSSSSAIICRNAALAISSRILCSSSGVLIPGTSTRILSSPCLATVGSARPN